MIEDIQTSDYQLAQSCKERSTADLSQAILSHMEEVNRMAHTSNNLKGTYVRDLCAAVKMVLQDMRQELDAIG